MTIRVRLFLVFTLAMIVGFGLLEYWLRDEIKTFHNQAYEEVLVDTSHILAEMISDEFKGDQEFHGLDTLFNRAKSRTFSAHIYHITKQNIDLRIYVTDHRGIVLYDSHNKKAVGRDYSQWRDVLLTLKGEYGARSSEERISEKNGKDRRLTVAYVAAPILLNGDIIGVVSVGKPKTNIQKFIDNANRDVVFAILYCIVFALFFGLILYLWISHPLNALVRYADAVARGERASPPHKGGKEIQQVAESMANMRQALEDKNYVEHYVQTLTHEIKSPLTGIMAAAELLESDLPEIQRHQFAKNIHIEAERLNRFANQLLDLASIEKQDQLTHKNTIYLSLLIKEIEASIASKISKKQICFTKDIAENSHIVGDPFLIKQAIENLLINAIEHSPEHGELNLSIEHHAEKCRLHITNQGEPIPEYALPKLFDRFYSLPKPTGKRSSGLGLNFVQEVADLHQGTISIRNLDDHRGIQAILELPVGE